MATHNHLPKQTHESEARDIPIIRIPAKSRGGKGKKRVRPGGRANERRHSLLLYQTPRTAETSETERAQRQSGEGRQGSEPQKAGGRPCAHVKIIKKILACDETSRRRGQGKEGREREREEAPVRISRSPIRRPTIRRSGRGRRRDPVDREAWGLGFQLRSIRGRRPLPEPGGGGCPERRRRR